VNKTANKEQCSKIGYSRRAKTETETVMDIYTEVKMGRNAPELSSWAPQNRHLTFLGPKFTKFLPEL